MADFKVKMRGTTYFGQAAGSSNEEYDCSDISAGKLSEEIRYWDMTKQTGGFFASLFGQRSGGEIRTGYISKTDYNALDDLTVVLFKPNDGPTMARKPAASYALYRAK